LDLTDEDLLNKFRTGVANIASIGLAIGYPTIASLPHALVHGFKNVIAVGLSLSDYSFAQLEKARNILANPGAFAAAPAAAASSTKAVEAAPAPKVEEKKEESDEDMGFGLFD
jgi:large subunit ribosomal protein LP0